MNAEIGQRGYPLTGNEKYLTTYLETLNEINQQLEQLRIGFTPEADLLGKFCMMSQHISRKLAEMNLIVQTRNAGGEDAWRFVLITSVDKGKMDSIGQQAGILVASSIHNFERGQAQIGRTLQLSHIGIAIMVIGGSNALLARAAIPCLA